MLRAQYRNARWTLYVVICPDPAFGFVFGWFNVVIACAPFATISSCLRARRVGGNHTSLCVCLQGGGLLFVVLMGGGTRAIYDANNLLIFAKYFRGILCCCNSSCVDVRHGWTVMIRLKWGHGVIVALCIPNQLITRRSNRLLSSVGVFTTFKMNGNL